MEISDAPRVKKPKLPKKRLFRKQKKTKRQHKESSRGI